MLLFTCSAWAQVARRQTSPLIDGTTVTFSAEARDGLRPTLVGDFNAWGNDGTFRYCDMLARAITPADFLGRLFEVPARPIEVYLLGGTYDVRFIGDYHIALDAFRANGYRVTAREAPIGHSPTSWRHYLPEMLASFFPPSWLSEPPRLAAIEAAPSIDPDRASSLLAEIADSKETERDEDLRDAVQEALQMCETSKIPHEDDEDEPPY